MARNEQLIRQHKLLQILERHRFGITLEELRDAVVQELGLTSLHERSVRRDLEALRAAGFFLVDEETQRGRVWKMSRADKGLQKISISATELIALSMGRDLLLPLMGTQFWQGIESFWNKVREQLPPGVWEHYQRYRKTLFVTGNAAKKYERQQGILKSVHRAIQEHRRLEIDYQKPDEAMKRRTIEPYGLAMHQSSIYVLAFEYPHRAKGHHLRHWKLDRFTRADVLDDWFKPDSEVDVEAHLAQSVGIFSGDETQLFRIRISDKARHWVEEEPWHAKQEIESHPDGSIVLTVRAYNSMEIIPRVLALGTEAEVIEPESCRIEIRDLVKRISKIYA